MAERAHLSIGEVLSLLREEFSNVTISKIRFLESQGLLDPERTPSGYRKFYEEDVERLRWILRQQQENFLPLKVIKGRLGELPDSAATVELPAATGVAERDRSAVPARWESLTEGTGTGASGEGFAGAASAGTVVAGRVGAGTVGAGTVGAGTVGAGTVGTGTVGATSAPGAPAASSFANGMTSRATEAGTPSGTPSSAPRGPALHDAAPWQATSRVESSWDQSEGDRSPDSWEQSGRDRTPDSWERSNGTDGLDPAVTGPPGASPSQVSLRPDRPEATARSFDSGRGTPERATTAGAAVGLGWASTSAGPSSAAGGGPSFSSGVHGVPAGPAPVVAGAAAAASRGGSGMPFGGGRGQGNSVAGMGDAVGRTSGGNYTLDELVQETGLSEAAIDELARFGLIAGRDLGGTTYFDDDAAMVASVAAGFARHGIEARHLRMYKNAADRESALFEQIVMPLVKQRNPQARQQAAQALEDLGRLSGDLRRALLRQALGNAF